MINKSVAKFCFASGMEACTDLCNWYISELTNDSNKESYWKLGGSFSDKQFHSPRKDTDLTLTKMNVYSKIMRFKKCFICPYIIIS